jgi:alcohol dehydrogenase (cytochrome c)
VSAEVKGGHRAPGLRPWLLALAFAAPAAAQAPRDADWPSYGRDYTNQRYSALAQITAANVDRLVLRRAFQTGTERMGALIASPIVHDGTMYLTTPYNQVIAWDLRSGRERWRYEHKLGSFLPCCGPTNRGAAVGHGLVFMATLDAHLVALDAVTGDLRWDVEDAAADSAYSFTIAPLVVGTLVIVGSSGAEYATRGRVTAYDARTGERRWRWYAVPSPEDGGWWGAWRRTTSAGDSLPRDIERERADSGRYAESWRIGGGSVWTTPAYDPALGLLYLGTGNPVPEYDATVRPGDNLYTVSAVALEAATGRLRWYHQFIPHDIWDYDQANPMVLVAPRGRKLVAHAGKEGWAYLLDARTGALVRRTDPLVPQRNLYVPPSPEGVWRSPGAAGGASWPPSAWSPRTGLLYIPVVHVPMLFKSFPQEPEAGKDYRRGNEAEVAPPDSTWGALSAVDLATGRVRWEHRAAPMGEGAIGGALATAGGLVFAGDQGGWFHAFDAATGRVLWEFYCGAGVNAPPVTFTLDGEQFVAVAAGGSFYDGHIGDAVLVFGLPTAFQSP